MTAADQVPVIPGFTVAQDPLTGEWVATSASGRYRLCGRTQRELEDRRWVLYGRLLAEYRQAIAEVFPLPHPLQRGDPARPPLPPGGRTPGPGPTV